MAGISVTIVAGPDQQSSSVQATGSLQRIITPADRALFGLSDDELKGAVGCYFGQEPNDAFLSSPTPWNDLYTTYGWAQTALVLEVVRAEILEITSTPEVLATRQLVNTSSQRATFHADVTDSVTETTEENWSQTDTIAVSQSINYKITVGRGEVGGETSFAYSHTWGQGGSESHSVTVGTDQGVSVDLDPGQSASAQLTISRGVMRVRLTYQPRLVGTTAVNYNPRYKGHHFWDFPISSVMQAAGIMPPPPCTEDISIGYFSNARVELTTLTGARLQAVRAAPAHA